MEVTPLSNPALCPDRAAEYLSVSRRHFERVIAPYLARVDLRGPGSHKPMPRYRLSELNRYLDDQRNLRAEEAA
jgi:hypothetical protein